MVRSVHLWLWTWSLWFNTAFLLWFSTDALGFFLREILLIAQWVFLYVDRLLDIGLNSLTWHNVSNFFYLSGTANHSRILLWVEAYILLLLNGSVLVSRLIKLVAKLSIWIRCKSLSSHLLLNCIFVHCSRLIDIWMVLLDYRFVLLCMLRQITLGL